MNLVLDADVSGSPLDAVGVVLGVAVDIEDLVDVGVGVECIVGVVGAGVGVDVLGVAVLGVETLLLAVASVLGTVAVAVLGAVAVAVVGVLGVVAVAVVVGAGVGFLGGCDHLSWIGDLVALESSDLVALDANDPMESKIRGIRCLEIEELVGIENLVALDDAKDLGVRVLVHVVEDFGRLNYR